MDVLEKKAMDYEKRFNAPYNELLCDQLTMVDDAIKEGDKERISKNLYCSFALISVYLPSGNKKRMIKKQLSDLAGITDHTEFIKKTTEIYHKMLNIIEEKTGEYQEW